MGQVDDVFGFDGRWQLTQYNDARPDIHGFFDIVGDEYNSLFVIMPDTHDFHLHEIAGLSI